MSTQENNPIQRQSLQGVKYLEKPIKYPYYEADNYASDALDRDDIDLRDYLRRVQRHKWLVAFITILFTAVAAYYLYRQPDVYQAGARVQVDSDAAFTVDERGSSSPFEDRAYFNTQLEILESPDLLRRVIKKLDLENNPNFLSSTHKSNLIVTDSSKVSAAPAKSEAKSVKSKEPDGLEQKLAEAQRLNPYVEALQDSLNVTPVLQTRQTVKDTRLISIKYKHADPKVAAVVVNAIADEVVRYNLSKRTKSNTSENDYLQNNIVDLKSQIRRDEEKLLEYGRNYELPTQDEKQNTVTERLLGLNRQLLEAENTRKQAEAAYKAAQLPGAADTIAETDSRQVAETDAKIEGLRQRRAQLLVEVTEKYPEVREIDQQVAVLEKSAKERKHKATSTFKTNLELKYKEAVARENSIRESYQQQWAKTMNQNGAAINYRIVQQSLETNRKLLDDMQQREKQNEMLKAKVPNNISIAEYALVPQDPMDPKNLQYLGLAFLFSFSLGIGGALIRDYFDDSVRTTEEVEKTLSLPALAVIPEVSNGLFAQRRGLNGANPLHLSGDGENDAALVAGGNELILASGSTHSPMTEAFRHLRTVLLFSPEVGEIRTLLITSSVQGEGKTTTSVNIATSLAQTGASVLLIDADLRSPRLHKIFNLENQRGLSNLLVEEQGNEDIWDFVVKKTKGLHILPSGPLIEDCAEHLGSNRMKELLWSLETFFDYIVVDSPPVSAFADGAVVASMVDGVLMVVQGNRSGGGMLRHSQKMLNMVGANIVGVVLNKVPLSTEAYYKI